MPKPIVKWAGGKGAILAQLLPLFPRKYNRYYEPFLGGGAVLFALHPERAYGNDLNKALMNLYVQLKKNRKNLFIILEKIANEYSELDTEQRREYFYRSREHFNKASRGTVESAAILIFLNRTCFNGLYRENGKGEFNVPFGSYKNPTIFDKENLLEIADRLASVELTATTFEEAISKAEKNDFVYFDPPYAPRSPTANFTTYNANGFSTFEQVSLAKSFIELDKRGCYVALSNSDTPLIHDLYKGYKRHIINAPRNINSKGDKRNKINELLITNY